MANQSSLQLIAQSYKTLGFKEYPFSVSADPRFLYMSSQHQAIVDSVNRVIANRQGLAVIEGDVGLGKSTLARRLHDIYAGIENTLAIYIHTASYKTSFEALSDITEKFGLPPKRSEKLALTAFEEWLITQRRADLLPIIIIDDAQRIHPNALDAFQYIYNFDRNEKLAQVILIGQTEIKELMASNKGLLTRVVSWQTISPLPYGDALEMINFRCQVAGRREPFLSENAFRRLWEYTQGTPRTMVVICGEALAVLEHAQKRTADERVIDEAIATYELRPESKPARGRQLELEVLNETTPKRKVSRKRVKK